MKKIVFRIVLALILTLVITIGSVIPVEAAKPSITISVTQIDPFNGIWEPSASFSYNNYSAWSGKYQWYSKGPEYGDPWVPFGEIQDIDYFDDGRHKSGTNIDLTLPDNIGWPSMFHRATVKVWLYKKNGGYVHSFAPPTPEPIMAWYSPLGTLTFYFSGYSATGYQYQWTLDGVPVDDMQYVWFGELLTSKNDCVVTGLGGQAGRWEVNVWLLDKNGHKIRSAHLTAGFTPF